MIAEKKGQRNKYIDEIEEGYNECQKRTKIQLKGNNNDEKQIQNLSANKSTRKISDNERESRIIRRIKLNEEKMKLPKRTSTRESIKKRYIENTNKIVDATRTRINVQNTRVTIRSVKIENMVKVQISEKIEATRDTK